MNTRSSQYLAVLIAATVLAGSTTAAAKESADAIYVGGDIVTMDDVRPTAEALAVKNGEILAVGERANIEASHRSEGTRVVDLAGRTLMPSFLDPHSHYVSSLTVANQVSVFAPPAGPGTDVASIVAEIERFRDERKIPEGTLIQAYGYDDTVMPEGRLLNRDDLDAAFPKNPVIVGHVSMHGAGRHHRT